MFTRIHHVAVAVESLTTALAVHAADPMVVIAHRAQLPEQQVEAAALEFPGGGAALELVAPLGDDGPIERFLQSRGPGLHHVAYEVDRLDAALAALEEDGVRVLPGAGRVGLHGTPVAFLHPGDRGGVLTELVEAAR